MRQPLLARASRARLSVLALTLATAAPLAAQTPVAHAQRAPSVMYQPATAGARPAAAPVVVNHQAAAKDAARMERHVGAGKDAALMVVGAAGIITGALIGGGAGTAVAIGGAAVGLYGLYNFVK